LEGLKPFIDRN